MGISPANSVSNTYSNGVQKWSGATTPTTASTPIDTTMIQVVFGCNIKTDLTNQTFKIVSNDPTPVILAHFQNSQVTDWTINTNSIVIKSCDAAPLTLVFQSVEETLIGDKRLWKIMEGGNIVACGDENL